MFDADRKPQQAIGNTGHRARFRAHRRVGHRGRVRDQAFHATQRLGQGEVLQAVDEGAHRRFAAFQFDSFLTLRGLRTLDARLRVHQENTQLLVDLLDAHPAVATLYYPGLASHPGHALAARQQHGFGAMLSVELEGGEAEVRAFVDGLQYFTLAESLGGVESLVAHPATMTHAAMSAEARAAAGISDGLLRLSVGIEHADDLVADIAAALQRAQDAAGCKRTAAR